LSRTPRTLWIEAIQKCGGCCWFCGREAKTIDHATPRAQGGTNRSDNLLPACVWCNNTKGDMNVRQHRKYLKALVVRRLISMGYAAIPNLHDKVRVVFYGEGNASPFDFPNL
jgi:hypothetical protein